MITKIVHRYGLVEYYPKETLAPMIEKFVLMDRRHDNFYERFMKQRMQNLNHHEQFGMENSFPFPIRLLRTVPAARPQKRICNTEIDSGVTSPDVLSLATPVTSDNSHHPLAYLKPSTSGMNLLGWPPTPIQQFIHNSRKSENKEHKDKCSQPDHPAHSLCFALAWDKAIQFKT